MPDYNYKFKLPLINEYTIVRTGLLDRLSARRLNIVSAPTGYGKSTLIAQWLELQEGLKLWYTVDEQDQNAEHFLVNLFRELNRLNTDFSPAERFNFDALHVDTLPSLILEKCRKISSKAILVFDDYHHIQDEVIHKCVESIALNSSVKVLISTRTVPPFNQWKWKRTGDLNTIGTLDLCFNKIELRQYLEKRYQSFSESIVMDLLELTEGWLAGLQVLVSNSTTIDQLKSTVNLEYKNENFDFDRLVEQFLNKLDQPERKLLLKLSLLNIIDLQMLRNYEEEGLIKVNFIKRLFNEELFLVKLERSTHYFKFHHLFRDRLRAHTESQLSTTEKNEFYLSSANWFFENGDIEEAFHLKCLMTYNDGIDSLMERLRLVYLQENRWDKLSLAVNQCKNKQWTSVQLKISEAWLAIHYGTTQRLFDLAELFQSYLNSNKSFLEVERSEMEVIIAYYTYNVERNFNKTLELCSSALDILPMRYAYARGFAWIFKLGALQANGSMDKAIELSRNKLKTDFHYQERALILLTMCYCSWMEADMSLLQTYANKLYKVAQNTGSLEVKCNALHFLKLEAFETANWSKYEQLHLEQESVLVYGLGVIRLFSTLLDISFQKLQGNLKWKTLINKTLERSRNDDQYLLTKYIVGHYLGLSVEEGSYSSLANLYQKAKLDFVIPITNNSDPNLNVLAYLLYVDTKDYIAYTAKLQTDLTTYALQQHNRMAEMKLRLTQLTFDKLLDINKRVLRFKELINQGIKYNTLSMFLRYDSTLKFLREHKMSFGEIQVDFINQLILRRNQLLMTPSKFTSREIEIMENLDLKTSNSELASLLFITEKTLKNHLTSIYKKLGVKSKREAVLKINLQFS